jgi:hypothetical protein
VKEKIKSKQYKNFKQNTFKFDPLKCNITQRVCIYSQSPNFPLMESFINLYTSQMSWEIQSKGVKTIFKMTWKYKDFILKIYEIAL